MKNMSWKCPVTRVIKASALQMCTTTALAIIIIWVCTEMKFWRGSHALAAFSQFLARPTTCKLWLRKVDIKLVHINLSRHRFIIWLLLSTGMWNSVVLFMLSSSTACMIDDCYSNTCMCIFTRATLAPYVCCIARAFYIYLKWFYSCANPFCEYSRTRFVLYNRVHYRHICMCVRGHQSNGYQLWSTQKVRFYPPLLS